MLIALSFSVKLSSAQNCTNPPNCIINPNMAVDPEGDLNPGFSSMNGWYYSHYTPTAHPTDGVGGTGRIWMWSYGGIGEGTYTCFNFKKGRTYQICLWVQSKNDIAAGNLLIYATTGLTQPAYPAPNTIPTPTTSQLIDNSFTNNYGPAWTQLVINYTPDANYNQLWIYPFMANPPINNQAYELMISKVNIIEKEQPVGISVHCNDDLVLTGPSQSCATGEWYDPSGNPIGTGTVTIPNADSTMEGLYKMIVKVGDCEYTVYRQVQVTCSCEDFEPSFQRGFLNNPVSFTETSTGPGSSVGWFWSFGDGSTSNEQNPVHEYAAPGTYEVCLTVLYQYKGQTCCNTICDEIYVSSSSSTLKSNTLQTKFSTQEVSAYNNTIRCVDLTEGKNGFSDFYWDFGDGKVSAQQQPMHKYSKAGIYNVCLTVTNNTYDDNAELIEQHKEQYCDKVKVGDAPYISLGKVSVAPNPAINQAIVNIENIPNPKVVLKNMSGVEVQKGQLVEKDSYLLKMQDLSSGVYIVEVQSEFGIKTVKLVKE